MIESSLKKLIQRVTRRFVREKYRDLREGHKAALSAGRIERLRERELVRRQKLTIKAAAWRVMAQAYMLASDNGALPANVRQVMYAARPLVIEMVGRCWTKDDTFTQGLLPDYMAAHPEETKEWDVVFDARGHFTEPHSRKSLGIGTLDVRGYVNSWTGRVSANPGTPALDSDVPTIGPANRYRTALFIEKEGFDQLIERAGVAERYDLAIFSSKGQSVIAARRLVDKLSQTGVMILVAHDFDKYGLLIAHWLSHDSPRYKFERPPNVIDLGLRLADVQRMRLQAERVEYHQRKHPGHALTGCDGASSEEINFLCGKRTDDKFWIGRRVELNAMTARQFVEWLESKLSEHGLGKVVPDAPTLKVAWRRARRIARVNAAIARAMEQEADEDHDGEKPPPDLGRKVRQLLDREPRLPWDLALMRIAGDREEQFREGT